MSNEELDLVSAADRFRVLAGSLVHLANAGAIPSRHDALGRLHFERTALESRFAARSRAVDLSQQFC